MNKLVEIYCDGAAMAYRDVAEKIETMIEKSPPEIKELIKIWQPFALSCRLKANEIYKAVERYEGSRS